MSRDAWFEQYERLYAEREAGEMEGEVTDEDLSEKATEAVEDQMADRADQLNDEKWDRDHEEFLKQEAQGEANLERAARGE